MSKISIIIPVYYNEENLFPLYDSLMHLIDEEHYEYEIVFVDDGSGDGSYLKLLKLREKDTNVRIVKLSRNFGSHTAILAGLHYATGDCATMISADLQDPPVIIREMYSEWQKGYKVVLAVRQDREEPFLQKFISNSYYNLVKKLALPNMPRGGFDCFMIDRCVIDVVKSVDEKNTTLMGQILWCGFPSSKVHYVRKERDIGTSRWTFSKKLRLFIDSLLSFSCAPIRMMVYLGMAVSLLSFIWGVFLVINRLLNNVPVRGWTTVMVVILIISGIQMLMLGVIGEYLWRNFDATRKRPVFIVEEEIGLDDAS